MTATIFVVNPESTPQALFQEQLLANPGVAYFKLESDSFQDLRLGITALAPIHSNYTIQTDHSGGITNANEIGHRIAQWLSEAEITTLILEDLDIVFENEDAVDFLHGLFESTEIKIYVLAREMLANLYVPFAKSGKLVVIDNSGAVNQTLTDELTDTRVVVDFNVLTKDQPNARAQGVAITTWDGALPHLLLLFIILATEIAHKYKTKIASNRAGIFEAFWPAANKPGNKKAKKEAVNVFHVTKRKIMEQIYDAALIGLRQDPDNEHLQQIAALLEKSTATEIKNGFYSLAHGILIYKIDIVEFYRLLGEIEAAEDSQNLDALAWLYQEAYRYHQPLMTGYDLPWLNEARDKKEQAYTDLVFSYGAYLETIDRKPEAIGKFNEAFARGRDDAAMRGMLLAEQIGQPHYGIKLYEAYAKRMKAQGLEPVAKFKAQYEKLLGMNQ